MAATIFLAPHALPNTAISPSMSPGVYFSLLLKLGRFLCMPQWIECCRNDSAWLTSKARSKKDNMTSIWFSLSFSLPLPEPLCRKSSYPEPMLWGKHVQRPHRVAQGAPSWSSLLNLVPHVWVSRLQMIPAPATIYNCMRKAEQELTSWAQSNPITMKDNNNGHRCFKPLSLKIVC